MWLRGGGGAGGLRPVRRGDLGDTRRSRSRIKAGGVGRVGFVAAPSAIGIERHLAAQKVIRIQIAEHEIGIGDSGLRTASAIANRAGRRPGALRSHDNRPHVHGGNAATAGADFHQVDGRDVHGQTAVALEPEPALALINT